MCCPSNPYMRMRKRARSRLVSFPDPIPTRVGVGSGTETSSRQTLYRYGVGDCSRSSKDALKFSAANPY